MPDIPSRLRLSSLRFVKLQGKKPFEDGWNIPVGKVKCELCDKIIVEEDIETHFKSNHPDIEDFNEYILRPKNYAWNDPELQGWIKSGGNYGVCCGASNLIVIDVDYVGDVDLRAYIEAWLPETFTVKTGSGKYHYYFFCRDAKACSLQADKHYGDIRALSSKGTYTQVVGPGSIHPDTGKPYVVEKDLPIAEVTWDQVTKALAPFIKKSVEREATELAKEEYGHVGDLGINVVDIVDPEKYGLKRSGDEFYGCHPVHGSHTGRNFWINPSKNVWYCFRHNVGGGPLSLIAVLHGVIDCSEVQRGWLSSLSQEKRRELFKILKDKYNVEISIREVKSEEKAIKIKLVLDDKEFGVLKCEIADSKHYLVSVYSVSDPPQVVVPPTKVRKDWLYTSARDRIFKFLRKELDESNYMRLIRRVQKLFNEKIIQLESREEKEEEKKPDFDVEQALKSPTLFEDIYDSLGKVIVGNATVRKNIVYDLAAIGAPKIVLGNPDRPIREIRSHSAVWLVGPPESAKSTLLKLIYQIAPKAHWVTRITQAALDRGFADKINNGVLIIPEGDIIYRTHTVEKQEGDEVKKILIPAENIVAVQLRMIIEDNLLCLVSTEKGEDGFYTIEEVIPVHPTVFIGSTKEPDEPQLKTRFKVYRMEKSAALSLEVMKRIIDGLLWKEQPGKYHPDELKAIYHEIYDRVSKLKAVRIPKEFEQDLLKIAMRLCVLFLPKGEFEITLQEYDEETGEIRERRVMLTRSEVIERIMNGKMTYEDMLNILEQVDSEELLNRRFEDIIRRIVASACLHIAQRRVEDGILYVDEQDIKAGYDLLEDIEKEFEPKPMLSELCVEVLKQSYAEDRTKWLDANEVAERVFNKLNEEVTKSRVDKVRRILKYLADRGRALRRKSGNKYVYIYNPEYEKNEKNGNEYESWNLDDLLGN